MKVEPPLDAGIFAFLGLEAPVARIDIAFQHHFRIGQRQGVHGARLHHANGRALHRRTYMDDWLPCRGVIDT